VIIKLAARYRLPAVYPLRVFVTDGGLISYGPVTVDLYPRVAGYIDRILKGERPGELPVQFPSGIARQPQDRKSPWPRRASNVARDRR